MLTRRRPSGQEEGAVAIIVAGSMVALLLITAMVLDFGLVRIDRQVNKSSADAATAAGLRGLDRGTGEVYPFAGACQALEFLRANSAALSSLPAWPGGVCTTGGPAYNVKCRALDPLTHATYTESVGRYRVHIESPANLSTGNFPEESLNSLTADPADPDEGNCDQLSVTISQTRPTGLGGLATSSDLGSRVRSVGRIQIGDEGDGSVALLVLERNNCPAITASGGAAKITVEGNGDVPGLIHTDSLGNGVGCGGGTTVISAATGNDITAKKAATGLPPLTGVIAMVALSDTPGAIPANAFNGPVIAEGSAPTARNPVTRSPIDGRYRQPVRDAIAAANAATNNWSTAAPVGWDPTGCTPTPAQRASTNKLWVNCPNFMGNETINATEIMFTGNVKPGSNFSLPNATRVYVGAGIDLTGTRKFEMHQGSNTSCPTVQQPSRARLVIKGGGISKTGGMLRLCNTSVILMSGNSTGCLPTLDGTAPSLTPCGGLPGTGTLSSTGGDVDWTAPNARDVPVDQTDWDDLEDLALWTETGGLHAMSGGGMMTVAGVFMLPNADFRLTGNGDQNLRNSQYIIRTLDVRGNGIMTMKPDPHNSVKVPIINGFEMVR